jgi:ATP:cob(I)alamin adenosyltransferase
MKIYTKTGDSGSTSLVGGSRVKKCDLRVWAYGSIDETNSSIGIARAYIADTDICEKLLKIQKVLFEVGAELASLGTDKYKPRIKDSDIEFIENMIDELEGFKPVETGFMVPGGTKESAYLDLARTDARRAERYISSLQSSYNIDSNLIKYVNRLSDGLYALARYFDYKDIMRQIENKVNNNNEALKVENSNSLGTINRKIAECIVKACINKSEEMKIPMVICVTDFSGNVILLERMDNSLLASIEIAQNKAYTAAVLRTPTHELNKLALPKGDLYGISNLNRIITFGGGFPLEYNGKLVGAIGVSGGTSKQDMEVSKFGVEYFEEVVLNGTWN